MSSYSSSVCFECRRPVVTAQTVISVTRNLDAFGNGDVEKHHLECFDPYGFLYSLALDEVVKLSVSV